MNDWGDRFFFIFLGFDFIFSFYHTVYKYYILCTVYCLAMAFAREAKVEVSLSA
jgi:hypothetical protein